MFSFFNFNATCMTGSIAQCVNADWTVCVTCQLRMTLQCVQRTVLKVTWGQKNPQKQCRSYCGNNIRSLLAAVVWSKQRKRQITGKKEQKTKQNKKNTVAGFSAQRRRHTDTQAQCSHSLQRWMLCVNWTQRHKFSLKRNSIFFVLNSVMWHSRCDICSQPLLFDTE